MSLKELENYTFTSKYAQWIESEKRRETWNEAFDRVKGMMLEFYKDKDVQPEIDQAYTAAKKKKVLGSQRNLQFGGKGTLTHHARSYNCCSSYVDRPRFFQECMYLLLCGCGTGFSVQKHHVNKLPNLQKKTNEVLNYVIPDSIEGWSDAVGILLYSYFDIESEFKGKTVNFDYSLIRAKGSRLSTSSGKAPGPEPLKNAISKIETVLDSLVNKGVKKLKPINAYDIVMYLADAVVSGGHRRSATIAIFSHDDEEMAKSKTGNWFNENPQRGRSNNSALILRDEITKDQFKELMQNVKEYGEPGFFFADNKEFLGNPCVEIGFWAYLIQDEQKYNEWLKLDKKLIEERPEDIGLASGWQCCNLSTINGGKVKTEEEFYESCENAAIIGTLQAGFTSFPYLGKVSEEIVRREALLGVSMTGVMENPEILLCPKIQKRGAQIVKDTNKKLAVKLGINQAARTTCLKPEGTSSCALGTSSGIHPHHAKRYIRRVQANKLETVYQYFKKHNNVACEESVWSTNDTDDIVAFCIEVRDGAKLKNQVSAIELLEYVKSTQINWVKNGKNKELCTQPWLEHNVSNTITVKESEWDEVTNYLFKNKDVFCAVSLLPISGDKDYPQAPFTSILLPSEIFKEYGDGSLLVSGLITTGLELYDDNLWTACDALLGKTKVKGESKIKWVKRCEQFAMRYCFGSIKTLTYLMKDVYNWKHWVDLNREYKDVDFTKCVETENNVKPEDEIACAGGKCEFV